MLCAIDMAARTVLAVLEHRTIIAVEMAAIAVAHPTFLTTDRMLLTLDAVRLTGGHAPGTQPMVDTVLLIGMALIDRLRLRRRRPACRARRRRQASDGRFSRHFSFGLSMPPD